MKKIIYRFVALTAIFIGLSACKKDEVILNLTYESEEIAAEGKEVVMSVESNTDWTAASSADWVLVQPEQGSGNATLVVTVSANKVKKARKATVTLLGGGLTSEVTISQAPYVLKVPEAAGAIEGKEQGAAGETIVLSVAEIPHAHTYKWYRDGKEVQNTEERTLSVIVGGTYTVAGENGRGEGPKSPEKKVSFSTDYVFDTAKASYEGGDYNNAYKVEFSKSIDEQTEIGATVIFYEEKPDYKNIILPARSYKAIPAYLNDYTAVGTIATNNEYSLVGTCFYIKKDGQIVSETVNYVKENGGTLEVAYVGGTYTIKGSLDCFVTITEVDPDFGEYKVPVDSGTFTFEYSGKLEFENNWRDWGVYYFDEDFLDEDYDLGKVREAYLKYGGTNDYGTPVWGLELWGGDLSTAGYDVFATFFAARDTIPEGRYTIVSEPRKAVRGTAERGYYLKPEYYGMACKRWNPEIRDYDLAILGQPVQESYLDIEKTGEGEYTISYVLVDSRKHKITANYSGHVKILGGDDASASSSPASLKSR